MCEIVISDFQSTSTSAQLLFSFLLFICSFVFISLTICLCTEKCNLQYDHVCQPRYFILKENTV